MVAAYAFVHLSKYVVGIFLSYAFEEGCEKNPVYKGSPTKERIWVTLLSVLS